MTKHTRPEFNKEVLYACLLNLQKHELMKVIELFNRNEMIDAIRAVYNQANPTTNDKVEKFFTGRKKSAKNSVNNS